MARIEDKEENYKDFGPLDLTYDPSYTMMKKVHNNLYLSDEQREILDKYHIDYQKCKDIHELLYVIEMMMEDDEEDDLANLSMMLSERDYYENYNK